MKAIIYSILLLISLSVPGFLNAQCLDDVEIKIYGRDAYELCAADVDEGYVVFIAGLRGTPVAFVLTDLNDIIVRVSESSKMVVEDLPGGVYKAYAYSYKGGLNYPVGQHIDSAVIAGKCYERSINYVTITLAEYDAGTINIDGQSQLTVCTGDDDPDIVQIQTDVTITDLQHYLITDTLDNILMILPGDEIDLNTLQAGVCRIYGVASSGPIIASVGDHLLTVDLTEGCFDLSDNYIEITKKYTDGGIVSNSIGENILFVCPDNGNPDSVVLVHNSNAGVAYQWVLTDESDQIIEILTEPGYNFDSTPEGVYKIYGVSYTGVFITFTGFNIHGINLSNECFDLSENYITINVAKTHGGTIESRFGRDREYICPDDAAPDFISPKLVAGSNSKHAYIVTDTFGIVEGIYHQTPIELVDPSEGVSRVYGLSYTGNLMVTVGESLDPNNLSDDCADLTSNYMELYKYQAEGGEVRLADGSTSVEICVGDEVDDLLEFMTNSQSPIPYKFLITDENNRLTNVPGAHFFDFESTGGGTMRVWGLSHTALLNISFGENIFDYALSDDCYELSSNYIEVTKYAMDIGKITTSEGYEQLFTCPDDGQANLVEFATDRTTNAELVYVLSAKEDNTVLELITTNQYDFEQLAAGYYQVQALAYSGDLLLQPGMNLDTAQLASGCSQLSDNAVQIAHFSPLAKGIRVDDGTDQALVCLGTDATDVSFTLDEVSNADLVYIAVDRFDRVKIISDQALIDFSDEEAGIGSVYALSFTGQLLLQIGDLLHSSTLSTDCAQLTTDFVKIFKERVDGALVFTDDSKSIVYICPDNRTLDTISFVNTQDFEGEYLYAVTDEDFKVLGVAADSFITFNNVGAGNFRVWGISYTGDFILKAGDHILDDPASDACWDISTNFVSVMTQFPDWDGLTTQQGETTVEITVGDGQPDIIQMSDEGNQFGFTAYVVTKEDGTITGFTEGNSIEFDGITPGTCLIFGLAYTGELSIVEGRKILDIQLSTDCYDLSDNAVTVIKTMGRPPLIPEHVPIQADYYFTEEAVLLSSNSDTPQRVQVSIQSLQGHVVQSLEIELVDWYVVDLRYLNLESGIYFVSFKTDSYLTSQRVVITN